MSTGEEAVELYKLEEFPESTISTVEEFRSVTDEAKSNEFISSIENAESRGMLPYPPSIELSGTPHPVSVKSQTFETTIDSTSERYPQAIAEHEESYEEEFIQAESDICLSAQESIKKSLDSLAMKSSTSWAKRSSSTDDNLSRLSSLQGAKLDSYLTPFQLRWAFGSNPKTSILNITTKNKQQLFYSATHAAIVYDYLKKEMKLLQGHKNLISSISADDSGRWLVSADKGEDSSIIVWDNTEGLPVNTIFNSHPDCGVALVGISGNAKYLTTIGNEVKPIFNFWLWTFGNDTPNGSITLNSNYKEAVKLRYNPNVQEHIMVAFQKQVVFFQWDTLNNSLLPPVIPTIKNMKKLGLITDCSYIDKCHECIASTNEGYMLVFGNTVYMLPFEEGSIQNDKIFVKPLKLSSVCITCVESVDDVIATGDVRGHIKFYDKRMRILYWCQNFSLPPILSISFNLAKRAYKLKDAFDFDNHSDNMEPCYLEGCECENRFEEYEYLYAQLVPSDATLKRLPFIVRDFVVATEDGRIAKVDYMNNKCNFLFRKADAPATAIETHTEKPYLIIGYANGAISLYNYETHELLIEEQVPATFEDPDVTDAITSIRYSPESLHLACGMESGGVYFLDPIVLTPRFLANMQIKTRVLKLTFSADNIYLAYYDQNSTVALMRFCSTSEEWIFVGKNRSHYKSINDILFSPYLPSRLFTIGDDRYLVEYDLLKSANGSLEILNRERIEQTAIPISFIYCPPKENVKDRYLLLTDNQFKFKTVHDITYMCCSVRLGPAYGCYKSSVISNMEFLPRHDNRYLIFANNNHIGIQKFPVDGNPYKYVGLTGHPIKILDFRLCHEGKFLFTIGEDDICILMWEVNTKSVEIMEKIGGLELEPFYCLIEGGMHGWLFREMQDLFYYMQILHQGENVVLPRIVTEEIPVTELPDLMRACGFYPSEYEIENLIVDVKYQDYGETKALVEDISFLDFVKLYINHRPAHGVSIELLKERFETFCLAGEGSSSTSIFRSSFVSSICERGEIFTPAKAYTCLSALMHAAHEDDSNNNKDFEFLPEEINFEIFLKDILGMDMDRQPVNDDNQILIVEEEETC